MARPADDGIINTHVAGTDIDYACGQTALPVGMPFDGGAQFFGGWIAEILVYDTVSDGLDDNVKQYFADKYGMVEGFGAPENVMCERVGAFTVRLT
jgi:hypothetical protein